MGLFSKKNKKSETKNSKDINLSLEELEKVTAGTPRKNRDWCPKVDVEPINTEYLTEEELEEVKAGVTRLNDENDEELER